MVAANFIWQAADSQEWFTATERSIFQALALFAFVILAPKSLKTGGR